MIQNIRFNDTTNMLVGLQDSKMLVWCYPSTIYVDSDLLQRTIIDKEIGDFGKSPTLVSFVGNHVTVRRVDGSLISAGVSPFPAALHAYVEKSKWDHALRLCRHIRDEKLWATLAAMAAYAKNLNTAEIAYGAIDEAEKVQLLGEIRSNPNKDVRSADLSVFCGNAQDAEGLLLQSGHIFRAIMLNITLFRWDRALELATKHKMHVDTVLGYRQRYLEEFEKKETHPKFLQYASEVEVDWDTINERITAEYEREKNK
uniref:Uncharacterized protein n=2 Tax=Plectus sambesii TaxID=2011161 RepID=A0A914WZA1_9BILA